MREHGRVHRSFIAQSLHVSSSVSGCVALRISSRISWRSRALAGIMREGYKPPRFHGAFAIPQAEYLKEELMTIERTFSIIKPDATARNLTGAINAMIEKAGLRIVAQKRIR